MENSNAGFMTLQDVNEKLEKGLKEIFQSERYKEMLEVMSKFHNYSLNNSILIMIQRPNATMVKGFRQWQELGRNVNKGEKAIKILAPMFKKVEQEKIDQVTGKPILDENGKPITEKREVLIGFRNVNVFDIEQTNGKELPSVRDFINRDLQDDKSISKLYHDFFQYIEKNTPYSIREEFLEDGVGGYYRPATNEIVISTNINKNDTQKFRVLIHEFAHAKLHNKESEYKNIPRGHAEAQAESVAYIVSNYYGLDTNDVSVGYIATWANDLKLARQALNEVQKVSSQIIDILDDLQREKLIEFYNQSGKQYEEVANSLKQNFGIDLKKLDKENPNLQLEILQKDRGLVLSGVLSYSEKTDKFHVRLYNNRIIPLEEFHKSGDYAVLNKEKEKDKVFLYNEKEYNRAKDFKVTKVADKKYVVTDLNNEPVSKEFKTQKEAKKHLLRVDMTQLLHHQSYLRSLLPHLKDEHKVEINKQIDLLTKDINSSVATYLTHGIKGTKNKLNLENNEGATIGWTLIKRPTLTTYDELKSFANNTKHMPSYANLRKALENISEREVKEGSKERELVAVNELEK